jgi:hypothetical protein
MGVHRERDVVSRLASNNSRRPVHCEYESIISDATSTVRRIAMGTGEAMAEAPSVKEAFELYEDGKHRRYTLLFSVNGGAFAVAKLLTGEPGKPGVVLGDLSLSQLSLGMVLFTAVMTWDIFEFGLKMRRNYLPGAFENQGKIVLLLLGVLLCLGWFLAGLRGTIFA